MSARKEALLLGASTYLTGRPCPQGHIAARYVRSGGCVACLKEALKKWREKNKEKIKVERKERYGEYFKTYRKEHRDEYREYFKKYSVQYRKDHKEACSAVVLAWQKNNPDAIRSIHRAYYRSHPERVNAYIAKRRAQKLQATPKWADHELIKDMYLEAQYQQMAVDHIVPLKGKRVCGLHWEGNLQLLTKSQNSKKGNKHNDTMEVTTWGP